MASNDDNPEPPPGLTFETNTLDFGKLQAINPFIGLISHLQDEKIFYILKKSISALLAVTDNEGKEDADSLKDNTVILNNLFELVEIAKRSSDSYHRRASQTTLSSNNSPSASGSRVRSSSRSYCSPRHHRTSISCSRSPKDSYYLKNKNFHKHSRCHRHYDSCSLSPEDTYYHKKEENSKKHSSRHKSCGSCSESPEHTDYHKIEKGCHKCCTSRRSLFRERSGSRESMHVKHSPKKRLKRDASTKACSIKICNSHVDSEDEHSLIVSEEMKRKRSLPDLAEKHNVRMEKGRSLGATARIDTEVFPEDLTNVIQLESDDASEKISDVKSSQNNNENVKARSEILDKKSNIPNNFFCDVCQLAMNSELMWESHINGKNHAKQVKKQTVYEISKGSLAVLVTPAIVSQDVPRFANARPGKKRMRINAIPRLQRTINEIRDCPVAGLDYVHEIISAMDVDYYCALCDAPCQSISIMPHLVGFRHQLRVLREVAPAFYEKNKTRQDKQFMSKIKSILKIHESSEGRGSIKVFREYDDPALTRPSYDQPGPSWRSSSFPSIIKEPNDGESESGGSKDRWLDMSKGVFYCTLCDSHMNNLNMWEAHVRGKRHLGNAKKIPGEHLSKVKSERLHCAISKLEERIDEELIGELVVGLDFIRETRGSNGELYNCFLCGSCSTNFDILDHILLLKHRTKYLEKLHTDGIKNAIKEIDSLELKENSYRIALINQECIKMLKRYGRGKVEVYQSKN